MHSVLFSAIGLPMHMFIFLFTRPGDLFCQAHVDIFHLGTSSAFSATQRYRFVHGHVHTYTTSLRLIRRLRGGVRSKFGTGGRADLAPGVGTRNRSGQPSGKDKKAMDRGTAEV